MLSIKKIYKVDYLTACYVKGKGKSIYYILRLVLLGSFTKEFAELNCNWLEKAM
jgi:hypothetical protein